MLEEDEEDDDEENDPTRSIGLRPPGRRGYEVGGADVDAREEAEELRFMRSALEEVRQGRQPPGRAAFEEAELEEVLRRERARIERWR